MTDHTKDYDPYLSLLKEWNDEISELVDVIDDNDKVAVAKFRRWCMRVAMRVDVTKLHKIIKDQS